MGILFAIGRQYYNHKIILTLIGITFIISTSANTTFLSIFVR